jgi:aspartate/methionine/tyrosine aminotransferase
MVLRVFPEWWAFQMPRADHAERPEPAALRVERSPFVRLADLIAGVAPGQAPINLAVGEPRHPIPAFVEPTLQRHVARFGRYPMTRGTEQFRAAVSGWLGRRYALAKPVDPDTEVLVLNGSREGIFLSGIAARRHVGRRAGAPAILVPNPFYQTYVAAAEAAGCEVVPLSTTRATGFLPDYDALPDSLLARTIAVYLCSPANPQGTAHARETLARLIARARRHGAMIFADECYSELWLGNAPPAGALEAAGASFENVVVFNSLSKRSSLPGLRCGFCAGDPRFLKSFIDLRNLAAPQVPEPVQEVAVVAYGDERHVEDNRRLYRAKFDLAEQILGARYGYRRPDGGFFLWLDVSKVGDDEIAVRRLWQEAGLRVVPGSYLALPAPDGSNPGAGYIRVALVDDLSTTEAALQRLVACLG